LQQPLNMPHRPSNRPQRLLQQQLEQQLSSQQHEASSQQQLDSQQPQPPPQPPRHPIRRSRTPQPRLQQQLEQQLSSQQQEASSQQHEASSQQHDFSQQLQLASQQHPQPPPSIRSSKPQVAKLGLARAMLIMSAPKKFHFIEHRLLFVEIPQAESVPTSGNARCRPTPFNAGRVDGCCGYSEPITSTGVRGTLKCRESESGGTCWGVPR
jgi:hypothetical protein